MDSITQTLILIGFGILITLFLFVLFRITNKTSREKTSCPKCGSEYLSLDDVSSVGIPDTSSIFHDYTCKDCGKTFTRMF